LTVNVITNINAHIRIQTFKHTFHHLPVNVIFFKIQTYIYYISGEDGFGKRILEAIKNPLQLFSALRDQGFLDGNNLLYLQGLIWFSKNVENHNRIVEYAKKSVRKPLHFSTDTDKLGNLCCKKLENILY